MTNLQSLPASAGVSAGEGGTFGIFAHDARAFAFWRPAVRSARMLISLGCSPFHSFFGKRFIGCPATGFWLSAWDAVGGGSFCVELAHGKRSIIRCPVMWSHVPVAQ